MSETTWAPFLIRSPFESAQYQLNKAKPWGEAHQIHLCITRHKRDPNLIVIAQDCSPPLWSPNNHGHWLRAQGIGLPLPGRTSIEVDPEDPKHWVINVHETFKSNAKQLAGLYRTLDGGQTWAFALPAPHTYSNTYRKSIAYDPASISSGRAQVWYHVQVKISEATGRPETIVYKSTQAAAPDTWAEVFRIDSGAAPLEQVTNETVWCHPTDGQTVWVAHYTGVWKSTNGGASFSLTGMAGSCTSIAPHPTNGSVVYAILDDQLKRSDDGGASIAFTKSTPYAMRYVFVNAGYPNTVMVTPKTGSDLDHPIMTQDAQNGPAATWSLNGATVANGRMVPLTGLERGTAVNTRLSTKWTAASLDPLDPNRASIIGAARTFTFDYPTSTFTESTDTQGGFNFGGIQYSVAWDPVDPNRSVWFFVDVGIAKTLDGGQSFEIISDPIAGFVGSGELRGSGVRSGPGDLEPIAGGQKIIAVIGANGQSSQKLVISHNFGATWSVPLVSGGPQVFQDNLRCFFHRQNPSTIYAGRIMSTDGGATFSNVTWDQVGGGSFAAANPRIIAQTRADCDVVWAVSADRRTLYKSVNAGAEWVEEDTPGWPFVQFGAAVVMEADPVDPNVFYAGDAQGDISRWNGSSWTSLNVLARVTPTLTDPGQFTFIFGIAIDPNDPQHIAFAPWSAGTATILRTRDGGATIEDITFNAIRTPTNAIQFNPHTGTLIECACPAVWGLPRPGTYTPGVDPQYDLGLEIIENFYNAEPPPPLPTLASWTARGKRLLLETYLTGSALPGTGFNVALVTDAVPPTPATLTLGDLVEVAAGNGYVSGGLARARSAAGFPSLVEMDAQDQARVTIGDPIWSAVGGSIPASGDPARWLVLTTDEATPADRQVLAFWDLFADRTIQNGQILHLQNTRLSAKGFAGVTNRGAFLMLDHFFHAAAVGSDFYLAFLDDSEPPNADWDTMAGRAEIPAANGYVAGGSSFAKAPGSWTLLEVASSSASARMLDRTLAAAGGPLPQTGPGIRYPVLTTDEGAPPDRQIIAVFDTGTNWQLADGETLTLGGMQLELTEP